MTLADLIIIGVMSGSDLQCASAKLQADIIISYDRDFPIENGNKSFLANELSVAIVVWMNCNCCICQDCFWSSRRYINICIGLICQPVFKILEGAFLFSMFNFQV